MSNELNITPKKNKIKIFMPIEVNKEHEVNKDYEINKENGTDEKTEVKLYTKFGHRHLQALLCFLGLIISYSLKSSMSVCIVAMTDTSNTNPNIPTYNWDEATVGLIMSSAYWAYIFSPFVATLAIRRSGAKMPLLISVTGLTILTFLLPTFSSFGWEWVCVNRGLQGFTQGFFLPCVLEIMSKWAHPLERGRLISLVFIGTGLGPVIMIAMSGLIASSEIGWPGIFYITGGFCIIWLILWLWLAKNTPDDHPTISKEELRFIHSMPGNESVKTSIPWKALFQSTPFWTLLICMTTFTFGYNLLLSFLPTYIDKVLNFNLQTNGLLSALPYLIMSAVNFICGYLSDFLLTRKIVSMSFARKLFNSIGMFIPGICLIVLGNVEVNVAAAIVLFCIAVGLSSSLYSGFMLNYSDISPNFAGSMMGITQFPANFGAFLAPIFVGNVVVDFSKAELWNAPFSTAGGLYLIANVIFLILSKSEVQQWN